MTEEWEQRAHYHLLGWGEWRRLNRGAVSRGYPSRASFLATGGSSEEFDNLVARADSLAARTCETVINGIEEPWKTGLEAHYVLQSIFKHNRMSADEILKTARRLFWDKARKWLA